MNPATRKSPMDNAKFRENYLSNLRLQASNNQKNLNANVVFKQTGSPPPVIPDYRTTTEKYADIEGLKVQLRSKLQEVTDGTIASQIVGQLTPDQIKFALNKWELIHKDMKSKFALGVPAPAFLAYLDRLMAVTEANENVDLGLQQSPYGMIDSLNQLYYTMDRTQLLNALVNLLRVGHHRFPDADIENALSFINIQSKFFNPETRILIEQLPQEHRAEVLRLFTEYISPNVISPYAIPDIISKLQLSLSRSDGRFFNEMVNTVENNFELSYETLRVLKQIENIIVGRNQQGGLEEGGEEELHDAEEEAKQEGDFEFGGMPQPSPFEREFETTGTFKPTPTPTPSPSLEGLISLEEFNRMNRDDKAYYLYNALKDHKHLTIRSTSISTSGKFDGTQASFGANTGGRGNKQWGSPVSGIKPISGVTARQYSELYADLLRQLRGGNQEREEEREEEREGGGGGGGGREEEEREGTPKQFFGESDDAYRQRLAEYYHKIHRGEGQGKGLRIKKPRMKGHGVAVPRGSIAHLTETYEKPKKYIQFGRYFVNKPKIANSILSLRTPAGGFVKDIPPQRLSPSLHSVVSTLVGKGLPSYEQISKLTDDDRDKLVDICRVCQVEVPSIPKSTNMDKEEKENYRFEVLRGELFAGNNSPQIVKEFKALLLKFINKGKVPRREGNEILQNLVELGL